MRKFSVVAMIVVVIVALGLTTSYVMNTNKLMEESNQKLVSYEKAQVNNKINTLAALVADLRVQNKVLSDTVATSDVSKLKEKPTYDYLKSITVYIKGEIPEKEQSSGATRVRESWVGTGSIVAVKDGYTYILTNNHVTGYYRPNFSETILSIENDEQVVEAELVKNSVDYDMALIRIKGTLDNKEVIKGFADYNISDKVYSVGNYLAFEYIYTEGTVAGYDEEYLICNMPVAFGCSGSIVTNSKGEGIALVFGIYNVSMMSPDTSKAICVKSSDIQSFLKENNLL